MKPLPRPLCQLIEKALNSYLDLDAERAGAMQQLSGKTLAVNITDLGLEFFIDVLDDKLDVKGQLPENNEEQPAAESKARGRQITTISGSSLALFQLGMQQDNTRSLFSGEVSISGDIQSGQRFSEILRSIEVDWEELLSNYTGDLLAHQLSEGLRSFTAWSKKAVDSLSRDLADYLKEESRQLPHAIEVEDFIKSVDETRLAVDRLQARIQRLHAKASKQQ